jgi:hypothetical protein
MCRQLRSQRVPSRTDPYLPDVLLTARDLGDRAQARAAIEALARESGLENYPPR